MKRSETGQNPLSPDVEPTQDKIYRLAEAVSDIVPGGQGLLHSLVTPPLQKRLADWIEGVEERIRLLEADNAVSTNELAQNDTFSALVYRSAQVVAGTSNKEKLEYLRNFVVNAAVDNEVEDDELSMLLNAIASLTPSAVRALEFYAEPAPYIAEIRAYRDKQPGSGGQLKGSNQGQGIELHEILGGANPEFWQRVFWQLSSLHLATNNVSPIAEDKPGLVVNGAPTEFGFKLIGFLREYVGEPAHMPKPQIWSDG